MLASGHRFGSLLKLLLVAGRWGIALEVHPGACKVLENIVG